MTMEMNLLLSRKYLPCDSDLKDLLLKTCPRKIVLLSIFTSSLLARFGATYIVVRLKAGQKIIFALFAAVRIIKSQ